MKPIAKKNFNLNSIFYEIGDEVKINNKKELIKLNEKGFIQPLSPKEIQNWNKPILRNYNKEED